MSQESRLAFECPGGCGMQVYWVEYHMPHCPGAAGHPQATVRKNIVNRVIDLVLDNKLRAEADGEEARSKRQINRKQNFRKKRKLAT